MPVGLQRDDGIKRGRTSKPHTCERASKTLGGPQCAAGTEMSILGMRRAATLVKARQTVTNNGVEEQMQRPGAFDKVVSTGLTLATILIAALLAKREFAPSEPTSKSSGAGSEMVLASNWPEILEASLPLQNGVRPVHFVMFTDLECPACRSLHGRLSLLRSKAPDSVAISIVHYPLSIHRFSRIAARALECANTEGFASRFADVMYAKQDSLGLKPWGSFAEEVGLRDTTAFLRCVRDTTTIDRIDRGRKLAESMQLRGTPVLFVNGWQFPNVPSDSQISASIVSLRNRRSPQNLRE